MGRLRLAALALSVCALAGPPVAGAGDSELQGVIAKTEQLRGLAAPEALSVTTVNAAGMRQAVERELRRERLPRADAAWDDALHLLGVLAPGQSLAATERKALTGQVAGLYVPANRRLYVLGARGKPPRSVIAHEVVHALQDAHFRLTRGAFAPRPADRDGMLAAQALVEGDATEVQSRYISGLSPLDLVGELGRTLGALPADAADGVPPFLQRELIYPYAAGREFVRALRERGGQRLVDRAFRNPPRTSAAVLDPARYLAGDPRPQTLRLPPGKYVFATTFGAADLIALTGEEGLAHGWLGGRLGVGPRGLDLRLATRGAGAAAAALKRALPASAAVVQRGRLVCLTILRKKASGPVPSCR